MGRTLGERVTLRKHAAEALRTHVCHMAYVGLVLNEWH